MIQIDAATDADADAAADADVTIYDATYAANAAERQWQLNRIRELHPGPAQ